MSKGIYDEKIQGYQLLCDECGAIVGHMKIEPSDSNASRLCYMHTPQVEVEEESED